MAEDWEFVELEAALVDLGQHLEYPATPDFARGVLFGSRPSVWRRVLASPMRVAFAGLVLVLLALVGVLAASPEARTAVAGRLGLRGAPLEQISRLPDLFSSPAASPVPSRTTSPLASPTVQYGTGLDLGQQTTLIEASNNLPLLTPTAAELGDPDAVYLTPTVLGGTVSLVYASRPGLEGARETGVSLLVLESRLPRSGFEPAVLGKSAGPETRLEELTVNGGRGVWLEGAPHLLYLPDARGQFKQDTVRLASNVLLWEQSGLLIRLEGSFSRDQALQIAASFH